MNEFFFLLSAINAKINCVQYEGMICIHVSWSYKKNGGSKIVSNMQKLK